MSQEKPDLRQPVTAAVIAEARALLAGQRYATLATLDPRDGHPMATRVNIALDPRGRPMILVSALALHTPALRVDGRCALLVGEPGKGDPIAHPRLSLRCVAQEIGSAAAERAVLREHWLNAHPKAKLYVDLPDFAFFLLEPETVSFVAGFGRAYELTGTQLSASAEDHPGTSLS